MSQDPSPSRQTSTSLLIRVRQQDVDAWSRLSKIYGPLVYSWARRAGLQNSDAADIVQDVFRRVARNIKDFRRDRPGDSFRGWLWTVTRNQVRDHFRKIHRQPQAIGGTDANYHLQSIAEALDGEDSLTAEQDEGFIYRQALELMKSEFQEPTWRAFWRVVIDGAAPANVAEELGLSVWSVYQAKSRILRRLRTEFAELEDFAANSPN